jgi:uncharacterized membrane protein
VPDGVVAIIITITVLDLKAPLCSLHIDAAHLSVVRSLVIPAYILGKLNAS